MSFDPKDVYLQAKVAVMVSGCRLHTLGVPPDGSRAVFRPHDPRNGPDPRDRSPVDRAGPASSASNPSVPFLEIRAFGSFLMTFLEPT